MNRDNELKQPNKKKGEGLEFGKGLNLFKSKTQKLPQKCPEPLKKITLG